MIVLEWIGTIGIGIMVIILIFLCVASIISTHKTIQSLLQLQPKKKHIIILSATFLTVLLFTLNAIFALASLIAAMIGNNMYAYPMSYASILSYVSSQTIMSFVFTMRIELTFMDTTLEYSNKVIRSLQFAAILLMILMIFNVIEIFTKRFPSAVLILGCILWVVIWTTLSVTLSILFIKPIEKIMKTQMQCRAKEAVRSLSITSTTSTGDDKSKDEEKTDLEVVNVNTDSERPTTPDPKQTVVKSMIDAEFLFIVIKHGILVPIAICSSFVFNMALIVIYEVVYSNGGITSVPIFWVILDSTVSSTCTVLLLKQNNKYYSRFCNKIHSLCERRKLKKIVRQMEKEMVLSLDGKKIDDGEKAPVEAVNC